MKKFFRQIFESISNLEYYRHLFFRSFSDSLKFYFLFLGLISLVLTAEYWIKTVPQITSTAQQIAIEAQTAFPVDLLLVWQNGKIISNMYPVTIPFPSAAPSSIKESAEYLAVIVASEESPHGNALFTITPTRIISYDQGQVISELELTQILGSEPQILSKATIAGHSETILELVKSGTKISGYVLPIFFWLFLSISRLYIICLETVIIFILTKIQRIHISFGKLYQLSMHIFVPAEIVHQITRIAQVEIPVSMLTLSFWIFFIYIFFSLQKRSI